MAYTPSPESVMNGAVASQGGPEEIAAGTVKSPAFFLLSPTQPVHITSEENMIALM